VAVAVEINASLHERSEASGGYETWLHWVLLPDSRAVVSRGLDGKSSGGSPGPGCRPPGDVPAAEGTAESTLREEIGASCAKKLERAASTRTHTSSLDARSSASRATARCTGGAEAMARGPTELNDRHVRHVRGHSEMTCTPLGLIWHSGLIPFQPTAPASPY
jgi:hypothetical protein